MSRKLKYWSLLMKCFQFCIYFICLIPISGTKSRTLARIRPAVLATRAPFSGVLCSKRKDHFLYYYLETHIILLFQVVGVELWWTNDCDVPNIFNWRSAYVGQKARECHKCSARDVLSVLIIEMNKFRSKKQKLHLELSLTRAQQLWVNIPMLFSVRICPTVLKTWIQNEFYAE